MRNAETPLPHAWLMSVLEDLSTYAEINELPHTARLLKSTMPTVQAETGSSGSDVAYRRNKIADSR